MLVKLALNRKREKFESLDYFCVQHTFDDYGVAVVFRGLGIASRLEAAGGEQEAEERARCPHVFLVSCFSLLFGNARKLAICERTVAARNVVLLDKVALIKRTSAHLFSLLRSFRDPADRPPTADDGPKNSLIASPISSVGRLLQVRARVSRGPIAM